MRLLPSSRGHRPQSAAAPTGARRGFTLIEVVVASLVLTSALLAMAGFTVKYQQTDSNQRLITRAQQLASTRLETVRSSVPYASLDTMATTESSIPGYPGFTRITQVTRMGGTASDTVDYRVVTVRVSPPGGRAGISKSSIVAAF